MSRRAVLALEDGLVLEGRSVGAAGAAVGEMVFTSGMTGYQEAVTDPSYLGQILCFAAPMIGDYGVGDALCESGRVWPEAVVMAEAGDGPGRAGPTGWCSWLRAQDVVAIDRCDTRRPVRRLRDGGAMRGAISTELGAEELVERARRHPPLDGRDLASAAAGPARALGGDGPLVVAIDCGMTGRAAGPAPAAGSGAPDPARRGEGSRPPVRALRGGRHRARAGDAGDRRGDWGWPGAFRSPSRRPSVEPARGCRARAGRSSPPATPTSRAPSRWRRSSPAPASP